MAEAVEEQEVAGLQPRAQHAAAPRELPARVVRQRDAEVAVDEARESRAVEPGARRRASPRVPDAEEATREVDDPRLLAGDDGGVRDDGLVVTVDGAEGAAGACGDAGDHGEDEQREANAIGQEEGLPSAGAARARFG